MFWLGSVRLRLRHLNFFLSDLKGFSVVIIMFLRIIQYLSKLVTCVVSAIQLYFYNLTRPFWKWVLRRTTGLCELQRICYCQQPGALRIMGVGTKYITH